MSIPIYLADAFVTDNFRGNPAGVCICKGVSNEWMQDVASEMNQAETAFLSLRDDADWDLRWFTPTCEIELCGHATMASGHILATTNQAELPIRFHTLSGMLTVEAKETGYAMDFPARPATESTNLETLKAALQVEVLEAVSNDGIYLARLPSEEAVRTHQPDFAAIATLGKIGVIITAEGTSCDFVSRFYAPCAGVPEDPATGSAHCALAPYWGQILKKSKMVGHQLSARGGEVGVELKDDRVILSGQARTFLTGVLAQL